MEIQLFLFDDLFRRIVFDRFFTTELNYLHLAVDPTALLALIFIKIIFFYKKVMALRALGKPE